MKKIILILILILPVVITALAYMIAGFVGRGVSILPIDGIDIQFARQQIPNINTPLIGEAPDSTSNEPIFIIPQLNHNDTLDLSSFIRVLPSRALFSNLLFESTHEWFDADNERADTSVAWVDEYGVLRASRPTTHIDFQAGEPWIEIIALTGSRIIFTIQIQMVI